MKSGKQILSWFFVLLLFCWSMNAQQTSSVTGSATVPRLVNFSGKAIDLQGKAVSGIAGATFAIYKEESGGSPLWLETQNVQADTKGNYTVQLGATKPDGLPLDLFISGEARWLGVTINGGEEQRRTLLLSVPYALKALDAETLGGKPASAFLSAAPSGAAAEAGSRQAGPQAEQSNEIVCSSGAACKAGFLPLFFTNGGSAKVADSIVSQSGTNLTINGSASINGPESVTSSTTNPAISGTSTGNGWGVYGTASGTSSTSIGVEGVTNSASGYGVAGSNGGSGIGVFGTSVSGHGVYGSTKGAGSNGVVGLNSATGGGTSNAGVYGVMVSPSATGAQGRVAAVWGDTSLRSSISNFYAVGVLGTADDAQGGLFLNNSPSGAFALAAYGFDTSSNLLDAYNFSNHAGCGIDATGNLNCTGSKNAVVPLDGGKRKVAMSAIEAPENWFEDFGSAQLVNGAVVVRLDPDYIQTVNTEKDYRVFPVPNGDCKGLYVTNKSANSFEVRELGGGTSNIRFDYRITAIRRKYETVRFADHTNDPDPGKMLEQMGKAKTSSSSAPVSLRPTSQPGVGVPVAQLTNK